MRNRSAMREELVMTTSYPDFDAAASYQVLYMGIPFGAAKRFRNVWYHETPEGYRPFALQGRVRPVQDPQRGPSQ